MTYDFRHARRPRAVLSVAVLLLLTSGCASTPTLEASSPPSSSTTATPAATLRPSTTPTPAAEPTRTPTPPPAPAPLDPVAQAALDQELILAAKANDLARVTELIQAGGDVNAQDALLDSAFLYAGAEGFNEILQLTLVHGAEVGSINRYGGTALIPASEHGHVDTVRILLAAGVPVNHVNDLGWTALQEAVLLNDGGPRQQQVVTLLLAAGADPAIRDPQGRTATENAQRLGFTALAALLTAHG